MNLRLTLAGLLASAVLLGIPRADAGTIFVTSLGEIPTFNESVGVYTTSGATVNPDLLPEIRSLGGIAVSGDKLFVEHGFGRPGRYGIGEYTTSGATVNARLFKQVEAEDIALSGDQLFASAFFPGTVGEYTTSGETISPALISGLSALEGIAVSGNHLFLSSSGGTHGGTIFKYTTSGQGVNRPLIRLGFPSIPKGLAVSEDKLFVTDALNGTIREYTTSGAIVNPAFITGLGFPTDIAVFEGHLFVVNASYGTIGEYTLSGAPVNRALISGLGIPQRIDILPSVESVPDASSTWMLLLLGLTATFGVKPLLVRRQS